MGGGGVRGRGSATAVQGGVRCAMARDGVCVHSGGERGAKGWSAETENGLVDQEFARKPDLPALPVPLPLYPSHYLFLPSPPMCRFS